MDEQRNTQKWNLRQRTSECVVLWEHFARRDWHFADEKSPLNIPASIFLRWVWHTRECISLYINLLYDGCCLGYHTITMNAGGGSVLEKIWAISLAVTWRFFHVAFSFFKVQKSGEILHFSTSEHLVWFSQRASACTNAKWCTFLAIFKQTEKLLDWCHCLQEECTKFVVNLMKERENCEDVQLGFPRKIFLLFRLKED